MPYKCFYVPVLDEDEVFAMKAALPHYKVRGREPYKATC